MSYLALKNMVLRVFIFSLVIISISGCVKALSGDPMNSGLQPKETSTNSPETTLTMNKDENLKGKATSKPVKTSDTPESKSTQLITTTEEPGRTKKPTFNAFEDAHILEVGQFESVTIISIQLETELKADIYGIVGEDAIYECTTQPELPDRCYCVGAQIDGPAFVELKIYESGSDRLLARFDVNIPEIE